jgi:hypothetical protein
MMHCVLAQRSSPHSSHASTSAISSSKKSAKRAAKSAKKQAKQLVRQPAASASEQSTVVAASRRLKGSTHSAVPGSSTSGREAEGDAAHARSMVRDAIWAWSDVVFSSALKHEVLMAALVERWQLLDWLEVMTLHLLEHC